MFFESHADMAVVEKRLAQCDDLRADAGAVAQTLVDRDFAGGFPRVTAALDFKAMRSIRRITNPCC